MDAENATWYKNTGQKIVDDLLGHEKKISEETMYVVNGIKTMFEKYV